MKIVVMSDSHGTVSDMERVIEWEKPDLVLHLGDCWEDAMYLRDIFPSQRMEHVPGNCDFVSGEPLERLITCEGKRIFFCHGHTRGVKRGIIPLKEQGMRMGADVILYGHTHIPYCDFDATRWVMNPGAMLRWGMQTYGVIKIQDGNLRCDVLAVKDIGKE